MNRDEAMALLREFTKNENLIKHALGVEAGMRAYAHKLGGDPDVWGIVGLIHDFDWEVHPQAPDHPMQGAEILKTRGYPDEVIYCIKSHATYSGCPRVSPMDKTLFACDELVGLITAAALVLPDRSLHSLQPASVRKRMKEKSFAKTVHREDILQGAQELGVDLDEHIAFVLEAMRGIAAELGLDGRPNL